MDLKIIDLETVANGAAHELFAMELEKVMENIDDPNTKADAARSITLTVTIKPDQFKEGASITVASKSKLASVRGAVGHLFLGRRNGKLLGFGHDINQMSLNIDVKPEIVKNKEA